MTSVKIVFISFFLIITSGSFSQTIIDLKSDYTEVFFSDKLNIDDLAKIKTDLAGKKIYLNYGFLKFGGDGKLTGIEYFVRTAGVAGSDKTDNPAKEPGFVIEKIRNGKLGITVGTKEQIHHIKNRNKKEN